MIVRQLTIYIVVGIISAAMDIGIMKLFLFFGLHYFLAATLGFIAGLLVNFSLHSKITFKKKYSHIMFARYMTVVFLNYMITLAVIHAFHNWLSMPVLGKIASLPVITINGFFLSKYWIYKRSEDGLLAE